MSFVWRFKKTANAPLYADVSRQSRHVEHPLVPVNVQFSESKHLKFPGFRGTTSP